jgi:hypothetical protein
MNDSALERLADLERTLTGLRQVLARADLPALLDRHARALAAATGRGK